MGVPAAGRGESEAGDRGVTEEWTWSGFSLSFGRRVPHMVQRAPLVVVGLYLLALIGTYFSVGLAACADMIMPFAQ